MIIYTLTQYMTERIQENPQEPQLRPLDLHPVGMEAIMTRLGMNRSYLAEYELDVPKQWPSIQLRAQDIPTDLQVLQPEMTETQNILLQNTLAPAIAHAAQVALYTDEDLTGTSPGGERMSTHVMNLLGKGLHNPFARDLARLSQALRLQKCMNESPATATTAGLLLSGQKSGYKVGFSDALAIPKQLWAEIDRLRDDTQDVGRKLFSYVLFDNEIDGSTENALAEVNRRNAELEEVILTLFDDMAPRYLQEFERIAQRAGPRFREEMTHDRVLKPAEDMHAGLVQVLLQYARCLGPQGISEFGHVLRGTQQGPLHGLGLRELQHVIRSARAFTDNAKSREFWPRYQDVQLLPTDMVALLQDSHRNSQSDDLLRDLHKANARAKFQRGVTRTLLRILAQINTPTHSDDPHHALKRDMKNGVLGALMVANLHLMSRLVFQRSISTPLLAKMVRNSYNLDGADLGDLRFATHIDLTSMGAIYPEITSALAIAKGTFSEGK